MTPTQVREFCSLVFNTSLGNQRTVRIPEPRENLTLNNVNAVAGTFIFTQPFDERVGQLTNLRVAEIVTEVLITLI